MSNIGRQRVTHLLRALHYTINRDRNSSHNIQQPFVGSPFIHKFIRPTGLWTTYKQPPYNRVNKYITTSQQCESSLQNRHIQIETKSKLQHRPPRERTHYFLRSPLNTRINASSTDLSGRVPRSRITRCLNCVTFNDRNLSIHDHIRCLLLWMNERLV